MQVACVLKHHDHAYVERRGGIEFATHLRGAPSRVEYRREAIQRAFGLFETAEREGKPDPEVGGLGLIVLQRAALAAEDLGGLLHALSGPNPWARLRSASIPELDRAFERAVAQPDALMTEVFRLASDEELRDEGIRGDEIEALGRLRHRTVGRWRRMLLRAAHFWVNYRGPAKATMHGFPFVAGKHVLGPPPAGDLARLVRGSPPDRFALGIPASLCGTEVRTESVVVGLEHSAVEGYRSTGRAVARLYGELCELQATSIMSGYGVCIPFALIRRVSQADRTLIEAASRRMDQGAG